MQAHAASLAAYAGFVAETGVDLVEALRESGLHGKIKRMIGGAPVTQKYPDKTGADGYTRDAAGAARLVAGLIAG